MKEWPLVGRAGELGRLVSLLTADPPRSVVLAGPPGVGKSRLAGESLAVAEGAGCATVRVVASPAASSLPFGALAPLLPRLDPAERQVVGTRTDLLRSSAAALVERAAGRPLVIFADDAHLLDDASATVIHQVVVTGAAAVLATVHAGAAAPEPILALWKDELAARVDVTGLSVEAIGELLVAVLGGPVDQSTVLRLAVRCEGNVLFLRELVLGALDHGSLVAEADMWRLVGPLAPSTRLVEVVEARLAGRRADERATLELVAFAETLGSSELAALADPAVAEALERDGLLSSRLDGRRLEVSLTHPLYGDVLRARLPVLRGRNLARSLADVVAATGARRRNDALRVAVWRLGSGGADPSLLQAGAVEARRRFDFPLTETLARAAIDAGAGFDAALLAAEAAGLSGRTGDAERQFAMLARSAGTDEERARAAIARFENAVVGLGDIDRAEKLLDRAEAGITDASWRDELWARRIAARLLGVGPGATVDAFDAHGAGTTRAPPAWAFVPVSFGLCRLGRFEQALAAVDRGIASDPIGSAVIGRYPWDVVVCITLGHAGRFLDAERQSLQRYDEALQHGATEVQARMTAALAFVYVERGHLTLARRYARESVSLCRQLGRALFEHDALLYLAFSFALGGRGSEAVAALAELDALGLRSARHRQVDVLRARAWTAVAGGDLPRACVLLGEAVELGHQIRDRVGEASAWHDIARLGHAKEAAIHLGDLAERVEGNLSRARALHADALARDDPAGLEQVSATFESMGADLLAAESAADAAVSWRRTGDPRAAAGAERRARSIAARCEGASTPALHGIDTRAVLTSAEREAAGLAAAGRSNKEIAEQLHLSVRTVETRLQHVYEKLGISGRAQLAATLADEPRLPY